MFALRSRWKLVVCDHCKRLHSGALKVSEHLDAVPVGKIIIQHQQIESSGRKDLERYIAVHRHSSLVALVLESLLQGHENILVVVRDQDLALFHCQSSRISLAYFDHGIRG